MTGDLPMPTDEIALALQKALDACQIELECAVKASLEASARAEKARDEHLRLKAAVAALSGEPRAEPSAPVRENAENDTQGTQNGAKDTQKLSPEEFDAQRLKKQRRKEKKRLENDPLAHIKCAGCGVAGSTVEQYIRTPAGGTMKVLACTKCNNQTFL